jgi:hypothetical protein
MQDGRAAGAHAVPPAARMEAVQLHQAAAGRPHHHRRERHRIDVVERQRRDDAFLVWPHRADAVQARVPAAGAQEIVVREAAALGPAGGTRGVEQGALSGQADRLAGRGRGDSHARHGAGLDGVMRHDGGHAADGLRGLRHGRQAFRQHDSQHGFAVPQHVFELRRAQVGVQRHHAAADGVERQPMEQERRPVLQQQRDAVAVAVAGRGVVGLQRLDVRHHPCPGDAASGNAIGAGRDVVHPESVGIRTLRGSGGEALVDGGDGHGQARPEDGSGQPAAKDAKETRRTRNKSMEVLSRPLRAFASFAAGCPFFMAIR